MKKFLLACSFAALAAASPAHAASLIGDTITCNQIGGGSFTCLNGSAAVAGGLEFRVGENNTTGFGLDFNGGGLRITNLGGTMFLANTVVSLKNITSAFSSATLRNSSIVGFGASDISLQNGILRLDFRNTVWAANSRANIGLDTASAVPEPGTWAMMLLGLGAMGAAMRMRRKQKVSVRYA